jgi:hypothetical protein
MGLQVGITQKETIQQFQKRENHSNLEDTGITVNQKVGSNKEDVLISTSMEEM